MLVLLESQPQAVVDHVLLFFEVRKERRGGRQRSGEGEVSVHFVTCFCRKSFWLKRIFENL